MKSPGPTTVALLEQVLLWYDGAQIVLLKVNDFEYVLAVAINSQTEENAFFGSSVSIRQLRAYQQERFDLRYLLTRADKRKSYVFSIRFDGEPIAMKSIKRSNPEITSYLPDAGFFARSHKRIEAAVVNRPQQKEVFHIDGAWDLDEFSKFYGQVGDLYNTFNAFERFDDAIPGSAANRRLSRPFRGGGSYLGHYNDIANDNDFEDKLRVSGIQYNSPGYVELHAKQEPFDKLIDLLRVLSEDIEAVRGSYVNLYGFLQKSKLLKAESVLGSEDPIAKQINYLRNDLLTYLVGVEYDKIYSIAEHDLLKATKIVLSIARRGFKLYEFFQQGRVQYDGLVIDAVIEH